MASSPAGVAAPAVLQPVAKSGKRSRGARSASPILDAVTRASLAQASSILAAQGFPALSALLASASPPKTEGDDDDGLLPDAVTVKAAALKTTVDFPPWIHWSKTDLAPQLKVGDPRRLTLSGPLRGYRMGRASTAAAADGRCYYYECWIQPGPSATSILAQLPSNARLGPGLEKQLQAAVAWEQRQAAATKDDESEPSTKKPRLDPDRPRVGGHVRLGWSMRTGDLQAPAGYDKWSYAIRDVGGSIIHQSQRQDHWGGEGFMEGDVVGCALLQSPEDPASNHIRFFKNGECLGRFVLSKGKRQGGEAFFIEAGTYYPAVSCYMGGGVTANFGPHWVCPPRRLPVGMRKMTPLSELCPPPPGSEEAVEKCAAAIKVFRKPEHQAQLKVAIQVEANVRREAYEAHVAQRVAEVRAAREERGLPTTDLPEEGAKEVAEDTCFIHS